MSPDSIPGNNSPDRINPNKALETDKPSTQPPSTFETYMQGTANQTRGTPSGAPQSAQNAAPANVIRPPNQTGAPTYDSLMTQAKNVQDGLGTVEQQIQTPNLKLKRSQSHLLKNKLQDANEYTRAAAAKLGVEGDPLEMPKGANPVGRFLAYIGDGQDQMIAVQKKLKEMAASNGEIRPTDFMFIQIKMSQAQQEIEYSSTLLGKVIDSIKTILNTQL